MAKVNPVASVMAKKSKVKKAVLKAVEKKEVPKKSEKK